jgi:hypothetical protein
MIAADISNGRRSVWTDFDLDDEFDDLVFTVARASER